MKSIRMLAAAAALMVSGVASAEVAFDPATGVGQVGKGDVQLAFGWNNAQLQANAGAVTFTYAVKATYEVRCEWNTYTNGNRNQEVKVIHHVNTDGLTIESRAVLGSRTRTNPQGAVTAFLLSGYGAVAPTGGLPQVGDPLFCNAHDMGPLDNPQTDSHDGSVVTAVTMLGAGEVAGLFVNFGERSVPLAY